MFSKATSNFIHQIDTEGSLIPVSRLNDSKKLGLLALVVKRNRIWFWQRPKYQPTCFTLDNLLQGDEVLSPGVSETEFLDLYKGTFRDQLSGKLGTEAGSVGVTLEGRGSSKLQSCFGKLKKEELDVIKLMRDSSDRLVNMQHKLVRQLKKRDDVLVVVTERILTTSSCSVTQTKKEACAFQGVLGLVGMLGSSVKVCIKDSNDMETDIDVSLEIPSDTVIAYSVLELKIKKNGQYDAVDEVDAWPKRNICLQPDEIGGIESDSTELSWPPHDSVDGKSNGEKVSEKVPTSALQNGSHEMDLSPLAELSESTRRVLFKRLQEILRDRTALSYLQGVLDDLCCGETCDKADYEELLEGQRNQVSAIMDLLGVDGPTEEGQCGVSAQQKAAHLLVSAMEELPDETLSLLSDICPYFLEAFHTLMCKLRENSESLSIQCPPVLLDDDQAFQQTQQLLGSANVTLRRDAGRLWTETGSKAGVRMLVLCLSIQGLTVLCKGFE